jgi:hypothetical protein
MSDTATWYLGPLGDLRALEVPDLDVDINEVRFGGIHQGLSGARTMDITGHRTEFTLNFSYLDRDEYAWLEALHFRLIQGPHRLINPLKRNRLTAQACRLLPFEFRNSGVYSSAPWLQERDSTVDLPIYGRATVVGTWPEDNAFIQFDQYKPVPVVSGEVLTASVYLKGQAAHNGYLRMSWYDVDQVFLENTDVPIAIGTDWTRYWATFPEPPATAVAGVFTIVLGPYADNNISIIAPQVEANTDSPTDWEIGGGAPVVLIDQMPAPSHRYPLRNVQLSLLEA